VIDPRAIVDPSAVIGADVSIGPWTIVGANVEIGDGCRIASHVILKGPTRIGRRNRIFQFATVGEDTPAVAYNGEPTTLQIGDDNVIREGVTIHRGTVQGQGRTVIGNHNLLMAYVHVGHDCTLGNHVIMANNASVSGHVLVGDYANFGGYAGIPQYRHIGAHAHIGGMSLVLKDVPAFVTVSGNPAGAVGLNIEGMRRRGIGDAAVAALREAYRLVYGNKLTVKEALDEISPLADRHPEVRLFMSSVAESRWGIIRGRREGNGD
jgi:UDP-N-acetylglucosamine acyltransferase